VIEWNLEDPKGKSLEVREIRDEIQERIKELVVEITTITPTER
jgi:protein-tyrosine-phosphatase